jgi:hypothetical protein
LATHRVVERRAGTAVGNVGDEGAGMLMMGVKSVRVLYGILGLMAGLAAVVDTVAMPMA